MGSKEVSEKGKLGVQSVRDVFEILLFFFFFFFVSLKHDGYMAVSHFFTQSFAFLLNTARSFGLQGLGSRGQTRQCSIVWSACPHSQVVGPVL